MMDLHSVTKPASYIKFVLEMLEYPAFLALVEERLWMRPYARTLDSYMTVQRRKLLDELTDDVPSLLVSAPLNDAKIPLYIALLAVQRLGAIKVAQAIRK